ncbi:MAG: tetratricopeptide repeat protein [Myxococcales bacterium]|nr:tetratricopeptide repeat protein [Myxococcales bacterium]
MTYRSIAAFVLVASLSACATTNGTRTTTPAQSSNNGRNRLVQGTEFRVVGRPDGTGDAYDARLLFERASTALQTRRFDEAIADFSRLATEFPSSPLVPAAHFNIGQAHQAAGRHAEAIAAYNEAATRASAGGNNDLARDAWFRVAAVSETANRANDIVTATDRVLTIPQIALIDRVEALGRQAAARLALGDRAGATRAAQDAVSLVPTAEAVAALGDDTYIAQARFVLGEVSRLEGAAITVRVDETDMSVIDLAVQRRIQHVLHAHVLYNDAIRVGNPHWSAAAGFSIGEMYRSLWLSIVGAQLPCDWDEPVIRVYRDRTANNRYLRPLLQGSLRAFEATIGMARRNAIADNAWVQRAQAQLDEIQQFVLRGPGPELYRRSPECTAASTAVSSADAGAPSDASITDASADSSVAASGASSADAGATLVRRR